jgi:PAS domain S-box-containing protein
LERFDALLAKVAVGLYIFWIRQNGHMEFEYVSDQWCELHQLSRKEALADASLANNLIHKDDIEHFLMLNREAAREVKSFTWEGRFIIKDERRWFRIESIPECCDNGDIRWYGVTQDITDRKQAEESLRESEEKFRGLADTAKVMISIVGSVGEASYLYVNDEWSRVHEYSREEAQSLKPIDVVAPESRPLVLANAAKRMAGERAPHNYEIKAITKSGKIKPLNFSVTIINFGNQKAFLTTCIDITKRKEGEQALRESEEKLRGINAQKDKLFSIIAHDLKSPFNTILGFSDILVDQIKNNDLEGIDRYATIIQESSRRSYELLMNLLEWSRSQTGRIDFNPEYLDMVSLIKDVSSLLNDLALQKTISIQKQLPHRVTVFADRHMTSTVLRNLISNAIKFTHRGGEIILSAHEAATEIIVSVKDNGIGIAQDHLENIFAIGESESTLGTANEKGTGLGLILCKEFIDKHGGRIWVESVEGRGSDFFFALPVN